MCMRALIDLFKSISIDVSTSLKVQSQNEFQVIVRSENLCDNQKRFVHKFLNHKPWLHISSVKSKGKGDKNKWLESRTANEKITQIRNGDIKDEKMRRVWKFVETCLQCWN